MEFGRRSFFETQVIGAQGEARSAPPAKRNLAGGVVLAGQFRPGSSGGADAATREIAQVSRALAFC